MKLTRHNGRSGKNGTYNPKHNDRQFDTRKSDHIDPERAKGNIYWDYYQGYHYPENREEEEQIRFSFEQVEQAFYAGQYDDYCEAQHERNRKTGHSERDRSTEDLRLDKKTCPEESLIQIGTMEQSLPAETLVKVAEEFFEEFNLRFGEHVHILDWSLHLDEATPHIHERHVFDCENRYGETAPQQEKALEALGFDPPFPDQKPGKLNNRKVSFDNTCRTILFDITRNHGLHLDEEPSYGGREYLEKQDYILMKQKEKMEEQDQTLQDQKVKMDGQARKIEEQEIRISEQEEKLEAITIRIKDQASFIEEITDTAYENAVELVAGKAVTETMTADLALLAEQQKKILKDLGLTKKARDIAVKIFTDQGKKFREASREIPDKMKKLFRSPDMKEKIKGPIRVSIREQLKQAERENRYHEIKLREHRPVIHNRPRYREHR